MPLLVLSVIYRIENSLDIKMHFLKLIDDIQYIYCNTLILRIKSDRDPRVVV